MPKITHHIVATGIIFLSVIGLFVWGVQFLTIPKIFMLAQRPYLFFEYQGPFLIALAILLAWFREWAAHKLMWVCLEVHRLASALAMAAVIGAEGFMHIFSIPHIEGWWIPLVSGGTATAVSAWIHKRKKKSHETCCHDE
jgi:hypothetical protein